MRKDLEAKRPELEKRFVEDVLPALLPIAREDLSGRCGKEFANLVHTAMQLRLPTWTTAALKRAFEEAARKLIDLEGDGDDCR